MTTAARDKSAVRDSSVFFIAQLAARALNFVYFLLLIQALPTDQFGVLNYALTIIILLDIVLDLGLSRHATREVSKDLDASGVFIRRILPYKFFATTAVFAAFCVFVLMSDQPSIYKTINICAAIGLFFIAPSMVFEGVLQAHQRFGLISTAHLALSVLQFLAGGLILFAGGGTVLIALTFSLTNLAYVCVMLWGLKDVLRSLPSRADFDALWRSFPAAFPYMISALIIMFTIRAELVILGFFGSKEELAVFGMATKIIEAALLLPLAFSTVMAPRFAKIHVRSRDDLSRLYMSGLELILLVAVPTCLVALLFVPLVTWMIPAAEYGQINDLLYITLLGFPAASVFLYNSSVLFGAVRQLRPLVLLTSLALLQVAVNVVLQSHFGMLGAAYAFVAVMVISAGISTVAILRLYAWLGDIYKPLLSPVAGTFCALLLLWLFGQDTVTLGLAVVSFAASVFAVRWILPETVTSLDLSVPQTETS